MSDQADTMNCAPKITCCWKAAPKPSKPLSTKPGWCWKAQPHWIPKTSNPKKPRLSKPFVTPMSPLAGRTVAQAMLDRRHGVNLLALARGGQTIAGEFARAFVSSPGDVLLLLGNADALPENALGDGLPAAGRTRTLPSIGHQVRYRWLSLPSQSGWAFFGVLSIPVAFTAAVVGLILTRSLTLRDLYASVDWPIIVLLARNGSSWHGRRGVRHLGVDCRWHCPTCRIRCPLGPVVLMVLVAAMILSDIMNNAATAVLMAPLAIGIAERIGVSADPLLMAVAVGSFLRIPHPY